MKPERRKELDKNELAAMIVTRAEGIKPYAKVIALSVIVVIVAIVIGAVVIRQRQAKLEEGWDEYYVAMNRYSKNDVVGAIDGLTGLIDEYGDSSASVAARRSLASIHMSRSESLAVKADKEGYRGEIAAAIRLYATLLDNIDDELSKQTTTFELAKCHEALCDEGSLTEAKKYYQSIIEKWPNGDFAKLAKDRVKEIDRLSRSGFFERFATATRVSSAAQTNPNFDMRALQKMIENRKALNQPGDNPKP